ncbi:hypothetical protein Pla86_51670 [Planctomycetes bacterium Pla86]|uniref:Uncharacterized protein n=2 Tax=Engelhardtia mirabilis TaxID=2528011 RepID=A0A518BST8_9BACT|nr:hypothetical protein Pla133_51700 [Planctomycetes bacterium Pla133]QDV04372.1 hypothetical protein Pla86_51670 [Planctomycetes bacterium Pla86]
MRRLILASVAALTLSPAALAEEVCTKVTIQINQQLVLTKQIFEATLGMTNDTASLVEDVELEFDFRRVVDGSDADPDFSVGVPTLEAGFTGLGLPSFENPLAWDLGNLLPGTSGTSKWKIDPLESATPLGENETFTVGGLLRYVKNGTPVAVPLFPVEIEVAPDAKLVLTYYLQDTVYSDDPLTPEIIEPSEPFILGLRIQNTGQGTAENVKISTGQPEIVENISGLIIAFKLFAAQIGCDPAVPLFELELGDIEPGANQVVRWVLSSSLKGEFDNFNADFTYVNPIGDQAGDGVIDTQASGTALAIHSVKLGANPGETVVDDTNPDFLVDEQAGDLLVDPFTQKAVEDLPTRVDSSDGVSYPVHYLLDVPMDAAPTTLDLVATVDVTIAQTGYVYLRIPDLGQGAFDLSQVARTGPDNQRVSFSVGSTASIANVWTTARNVDFANAIDPDGPGNLVPDAVQHLIHVFQEITVPGDYRYDLVFQPAPDAALSGDIDLVSVATGGTQVLSLNPGVEYGFRFYFMLGSITPQALGLPIVVNGIEVPLVFDAYTLLLLTDPAFQASLNFIGSLSGSGQAQAVVAVPPGLSPTLAGITFRHAYVLLDPVAQIVDFASNDESLTLVP